MTTPKWLLRSVVDAMHDAQIAEHGGAAGIRDEGMLESALNRPINKFNYGDSDICNLAAAYAAGIARNHPFVDGNKRTAFLSAFVFLRINGVRMTASEAAATRFTLALAAGELDEIGYAAWLRDNTAPV